jgi:hypothetical protein
MLGSIARRTFSLKKVMLTYRPIIAVLSTARLKVFHPDQEAGVSQEREAERNAAASLQRT